MIPRRTVGTAILAAVALLAGALSAFVFQPFGGRIRIAATVALLLGAIIFLAFRPRAADRRPRALMPRPVALALIVELTAWLGLILWSSMIRGGPMPGPKPSPDSTRFLTWNILVGSDRGAGSPGSRTGVAERREAEGAVQVDRDGLVRLRRPGSRTGATRFITRWPSATPATDRSRRPSPP